jgi:branched-subunit amino acid ABC-type transport system permease component
VGDVTTFPPVAASYHSTTEPLAAEAVAVMVCAGLCKHWVMFPPLVGAGGTAFMVKTTAVLVKLRQLVVLFFAAAWYVIVPTPVKVGVVTILPPDDVVYHSTTEPLAAEAVAVMVCAGLCRH